MTVVTQFNPALVGATDAVSGIGDTVLVVSPRTEQMTILDPVVGAPRSKSLYLPGIEPSAISLLPDERGAVVLGRNGSVVLLDLAGKVPTELTRLSLPGPSAGKWIASGYGPAEAGRRRSMDGRRLIETAPPGPTPRIRITDSRSFAVAIAPYAHGLVSFQVFADELVQVSDIAGVTPLCEAGAFDADTGLLYVVDAGGQGCAVRVNPDCSLDVLEKFTFESLQGPVSARVIDSVLYITNERLNALRALYLGDLLAPVSVQNYKPPIELYWERSPVQSQESGGVVARLYGDMRHVIPTDQPVTRSDRRVNAPNDVWQWILHGPVSKITYGVYDMTVRIAVRPDGLNVRSEFDIDDDLRLRSRGFTLSDTKLNTSWYAGPTQTWFPETQTGIFDFSLDREIDLTQQVEHIPGYVLSGDLVDVDLSNGWSAGYMDQWIMTARYDGAASQSVTGGVSVTLPDIGWPILAVPWATATLYVRGRVVTDPAYPDQMLLALVEHTSGVLVDDVAAGLMVLHPYSFVPYFLTEAPTVAYLANESRHIPAPGADYWTAGRVVQFGARVEGDNAGPFTYSFWLGAQYGPPAKQGEDNLFEVTLPASGGVVVVSVLVTSQDGAAASAIFTKVIA